MITMLLGGLWHGAGVAYLLWGLYHGLLLAIHRAVAGQGRSPAGAEAAEGRHPLLLRVGLTVAFFHLTCLGFLLFRAGGLAHDRSQWSVLGQYLGAMTNFRLSNGLSPLLSPVVLLGGIALFVQWRHAAMDQFSTWKPGWQAGAVTAALAAIFGLGVFEGSSFIYFQF
jgi:hypothetical protein